MTERTVCEIGLAVGKVTLRLSVPFKQHEIASVRKQFMDAMRKSYDEAILDAKKKYAEGQA